MFRFAVGNLRSRPVRSILSILGLTVAIAGMVGLFSIAGGIDHLVRGTFSKIPGLLVQQRGAPIPLFSSLPVAWRGDLEQIKGVRVVNGEVLVRINRIGKKDIVNPPRFLIGVEIASRLQLQHGIFDEYLVEGRFLKESDKGTANCVISRAIGEEVHKVVGDIMRVNGRDLKVIGIYHSGSLLIDVNVVMDIGVVREMGRIASDSVSCFYVEGDNSLSQHDLSRSIEKHFVGRETSSWKPDFGALQQLGGISPGILMEGLKAILNPTDPSETAAPTEPAEITPEPDESPVEARSSDDWNEKFQEFSGDLNLFLSLMTTIGVLIAVLSIVNTMLMSVTERMIEFGILRANGWTRADIVRLITCESATLGVVGGVLGATFGWLAVQALNWKFPDRMHLYAGFGLIAISLLMSTLLGILGGVYPAWLAARMSPMQAIRRG